MFVDGLKCGAVALSSRSDQPPDLVSFHVRAIIQMCKSRQSRKILRPRRARSNRAPTKKPQPKNLAAETLVVRKNRSAGVSPASEPRQLLLGQHDLCRLEAGDTFFLTTTEFTAARRIPFWVQPGEDFCSWERRYPVHHEDAKTRRNPLRFFASSRVFVVRLFGCGGAAP